jgi:hypothetical protein
MIPIAAPNGRVFGFSSPLTAISIKPALIPVAIAVPSNRPRMLEFDGTNTATIPVNAAIASE